MLTPIVQANLAKHRSRWLPKTDTRESLIFYGPHISDVSYLSENRAAAWFSRVSHLILWKSSSVGTAIVTLTCLLCCSLRWLFVFCFQLLFWRFRGWFKSFLDELTFLLLLCNLTFFFPIIEWFYVVAEYILSCDLFLGRGRLRLALYDSPFLLLFFSFFSPFLFKWSGMQ